MTNNKTFKVVWVTSNEQVVFKQQNCRVILSIIASVWCILLLYEWNRPMKASENRSSEILVWKNERFEVFPVTLRAPLVLKSAATEAQASALLSEKTLYLYVPHHVRKNLSTEGTNKWKDPLPIDPAHLIIQTEIWRTQQRDWIPSASEHQQTNLWYVSCSSGYGEDVLFAAHLGFQVALATVPSQVHRILLQRSLRELHGTLQRNSHRSQEQTVFLSEDEELLSACSNEEGFELTMPDRLLKVKRNSSNDTGNLFLSLDFVRSQSFKEGRSPAVEKISQQWLDFYTPSMFLTVHFELPPSEFVQSLWSAAQSDNTMALFIIPISQQCVNLTTESSRLERACFASLRAVKLSLQEDRTRLFLPGGEDCQSLILLLSPKNETNEVWSSRASDEMDCWSSTLKETKRPAYPTPLRVVFVILSCGVAGALLWSISKNCRAQARRNRVHGKEMSELSVETVV